MLDTALNQPRLPHLLEPLIEVLRIPSVSTDPDRAADLEAAARWLADYLSQLGLHDVALLESGGAPVVYGQWLEAGPAAPTLLAYGHYDVQPPEPLEAWHSPPFEPTVRGDRLFCRGASDDKGQVFAVISAVGAYLQAAGRLPLNVKFIIEGEEEISSPHMEAFVAAKQARLACDVVLICDGSILGPEQPLLEYGVRGNCYMQIDVSGPRGDLHSGTFGGIIDNPFNVLVRLLAALQDGESRKVLIPGFYDRVRPLNAQEKQLLAQAPIDDELALQLTGAPAVAGEAGYSTAERVSVRPTFDIHGLPGGFTGPGRKTVIPARATAKVSMRLVPDQDPVEIARLFEAYVMQLAPPTVQVEVTRLGASRPAVVDLDDPFIRAAARAYERGFGRAPAYLRGGGSLPIVPMFQERLGAPVALMGLGLPDDNIHAPNEFLHLPTFERGIATLIHYFDLLATM